MNKQEKATHNALRKRIRYGQNFIKDQELARKLVQLSGLGPENTVVEVGPGIGVFTQELLEVCNKVIAYEIDDSLVRFLRRRFRKNRNFEIVECDFRSISLPNKPFSCFANLPFNITAEVFRKLKGAYHLEEAFLVMQLEAAQKYTGIPKTTETSVLAKVAFDLSILHVFERSDFEPIPKVECAMLQMKRLSNPVLDPADTEEFDLFVQYAFRATKPSLKSAFKHVFTHDQWKRLGKDLEFERSVTATQLTFEQWVGLYRYFKVGVEPEKKTREGLVPSKQHSRMTNTVSRAILRKNMKKKTR